MQAVIGIDMGTQTTKAQVVSVDGRPLATADVAVSVERSPDGRAEQDPSVIVGSVVESVSRAVAAAPPATEILALGAAGQMGGAIGLGAGFEPVTPYESWLDTRADAERAQMLERHGSQIVAANGIIPFVGPRVTRWLKTDPGLRQRLCKVVAPAGYVTGRLTGADSAADATCDRTQAHLFGCFDVPAGRWHPDLTVCAGLSGEVLPRIIEPAGIAGGLAPELARRCGLVAGTPVAGGLGDGTAGWVAAGAFDPGTCVDTGGSSEHFAITVGAFTPDPFPGTLLTCMPSAAPGRYHLFGFTAGTGMTRRWWVHFAAAGDYDVLERAAAVLPVRPTDPLAVPHLHGMLSPFDPDVRGALVGFDETSEAAHVYRALFEAMAFEFAAWIARTGELSGGDLHPNAVLAIGGAARSAVGAQVKADVLGIPYVRMRPHVNAARGAALVAAAAIGAAKLDEPSWHDPEVTVVSNHTPDPGARAVYRARRRAYHMLLPALQPIYRELAALADEAHKLVSLAGEGEK